MHAIQYSTRIYITFFLCLCAAFLLAPSVANANDGYWSTSERRFITERERNIRLQRVNQLLEKPASSTLATTPSAPTVTKNATGGLSASTNQILKTMGQPSTFTSTQNFSLSSAKNALKSCVRSSACAGRTLGAGGLIYEGIKGWKDVYDFTLGDDGQIYKPSPENEQFPAPGEREVYVPPYDDSKKTPSFRLGGRNSGSYAVSVAHERPGPGVEEGTAVLVEEYGNGNRITKYTCNIIHSNSGLTLVGYDSPDCQYDVADTPPETNKPKPLVPASPSELDDAIDEGYEPAVSDAPIVLSSAEPSSISLTTPAPAQLPSTTTTNTSSSGTTTTITNQTINYNVVDNDTPSPKINSSITSTSTTYDSNSNVIDTSTSTTTEMAVPSDTSSSAPVELDFELPSFCSWASIVCDWIGWTQEPLDEDEPDLSQLITVFEPDEDEFNLGIGSGSCPAPMMLNLGIINKTVEIKYDPFCSFLEMIRPFVLAAAYLFAAYMYLGVLRRG